MISSLIISLTLTLILELLLSYVLGVRNVNDLKIIVFANIFTNPIVVFLGNIILIMNNMLVFYITLFILEMGAIIIEALLYSRYLKKINSIRLSIYNNLFSFLVGLILIILRGEFYEEKDLYYFNFVECNTFRNVNCVCRYVVSWSSSEIL